MAFCLRVFYWNLYPLNLQTSCFRYSCMCIEIHLQYLVIGWRMWFTVRNACIWYLNIWTWIWRNTWILPPTSLITLIWLKLVAFYLMLDFYGRILGLWICWSVYQLETVILYLSKSVCVTTPSQCFSLIYPCYQYNILGVAMLGCYSRVVKYEEK